MFGIAPANTGDGLKAMAPEAVRTLWQQGVDIFEQTGDPFSQFEGGPDSIIETITDTSKGAGMTIHFTPRSGFYGEARLGSERFTDPAHFDKIKIGHDLLTVDYLRWGTSYDARMEELMGMRNEIIATNNVEIGNWMAREKGGRMAATILWKSRSDNYLIAGSRANIHALQSTDTLSVDEVIGMNAFARPRGGLPAMISTDENGNAIWGNQVLATTAAVTGLKFDPDYKLIIKDSDVRGSGNLAFKGGIKSIDGNAVREWIDVDHDGDGAIGTPFNPKAYLGVPITADTTTFNITGGGSLNSAGASTALFFKWFPKFAFRFLVNDVLSDFSLQDLHTVSANTRFYVTIVNPRNTGDAANDGKHCIYEVNVNNGNVLQVVRRLGPTATGAAVTTLGGITWDGAKHTQVHPSGALIYRSTDKGVPFGYTPMLLKAALRRGYGKERNHRGQEDEEAGFVTNVYVRSVFGQAPRKRVDGLVPGIVILKHAIRYEGWNVPTYTA